MSVYKEVELMLVGMFQEQVRIYPDSCDIGIKVRDLQDPILERIRTILHSPEYAGSFKKHRIANVTSQHAYVTVAFCVPWEFDRTPNYNATKWSIYYHRDNRAHFVSLTHTPVMCNLEEVYNG